MAKAKSACQVFTRPKHFGRGSVASRMFTSPKVALCAGTPRNSPLLTASPTGARSCPENGSISDGDGGGGREDFLKHARASTGRQVRLRQGADGDEARDA